MTKRVLLWLALVLLGALFGFEMAWLVNFTRLDRVDGPRAAGSGEWVEITLSATVDGSERFIFTRENVWDDHGRWQMPSQVLFNGEPWADLSQAPPGWTEFAASLDLTKARIITREGRDVIALEPTADGFDLYFADTQMGAGKYSVTISIPRH